MGEDAGGIGYPMGGFQACRGTVKGIERPATLVDALTNDKLREAEGFLVRRNINAVLSETLEWNRAK